MATNGERKCLLSLITSLTHVFPIATSTKCSMPCAGDAARTCGGPDALTAVSQASTPRRVRAKLK